MKKITSFLSFKITSNKSITLKKKSNFEEKKVEKKPEAEFLNSSMASSSDNENIPKIIITPFKQRKKDAPVEDKEPEEMPERSFLGVRGKRYERYNSLRIDSSVQSDEDKSERSAYKKYATVRSSSFRDSSHSKSRDMKSHGGGVYIKRKKKNRLINIKSQTFIMERHRSSRAIILKSKTNPIERKPLFVTTQSRYQAGVVRAATRGAKRAKKGKRISK